MSKIVELFVSFFLIGLGAYGGGTVVIPLIEHEIVLTQAWLTASEFAQVVALSQMTPGPIAINAATFVGFHIAGFWGSAAATMGVITPSVILMTLVIKTLKCFEKNCAINRIRQGIRPGVLALIFIAVITIGKTTIYDSTTFIIALASFLLLYYFKEKLHPVVVIIIAGILGIFILL